jgi:hypothetical protein
MVLAEGIAVSGEYVSTLKDKSFTVIKAPHYEEIADMDNPDKKQRKLVVRVRLTADSAELDYYPNKTSIKTMCNLWGFEMDNWLNKVFLWTTTEQKVMGQLKQVLFVADKVIE